MNSLATKKEELIEEVSGIKISDQYRWLEDPSSKDVQEWVKNQNQITDSTLRNEQFSIFSQELVKNFKVVNFSNPSPARGRYFYTERQPDEDQHALYVKNGLDGNSIKLVDPNGLKKGNTISISFWNHSRTGKYVSYGLDEGGNEMSTMYVKDVDTNKNLKDMIANCRHSKVQWLPDDSGFFYTRNPRPGAVPKNEEHLHVKIYLHKLGGDPNDDELIFGKDRPKDDMLSITLSLDGRYLGIQTSRTWTENELYIYDREIKEIKSLVVGIPSIFSIRFLKDKIIINTNYEANNYRLLFSSLEDMFKPIDEWKEFIPEREYLLQSIAPTEEKILIEYLVNACSEVLIFDYSGKEIGKIPLPKFSTLAGISTNKEEKEFFYGVDSFTFPKILYHFNSDTNEYAEYRRTENPIKSEDYEVKQEWFHSKDNTKVPIFIFHKKGVKKDGLNPAILLGYGGFNNIQQPAFMRNWVPWIERGGIFAIANIRGGGEFGDKWHKGGIKENKQNSFDDFISAAEYLICQKYTDKNHLGILGGSNGGLLVSAVSVQRPDIFKAVCSRVPLTDMARFPKFGIAMRWVCEYGDPEIPEELRNILKWSPYHNIREGVEYPTTLFTTANNDTRVDPLHARKMTAILQEMNKKNNILLFTEIEVGHGGGKPIAKIVESQALILSFFSQELGLKI